MVSEHCVRTAGSFHHQERLAIPTDAYEFDTSALRQAIAALDRTIAVRARREAAGGVPSDELDALQAGVIQCFAFTYELAWKFMKRWIVHNVSRDVVDGVPRRELFRLAAEYRLIDEVERWMDFHHARNLTSHTYQVKLASAVFEQALLFVEGAKRFAARLEERRG